MNELDELEWRVLRTARQSLEPGSADGSRVWAALSARLGMVGVAVPTQQPPMGADLQAGAASKAATGVAAKGYTLLAVAALTGAAGFGSGYWVGHEPARGSTIQASAAPRARPSAQSSQAIPGATTAKGFGAAVAAERGASAQDSQLDAPALSASAVPALASDLSQGARSLAPGSDESLYDELRLLERAERAIRSKNPLLALSLLEDLGTRFPHGRLREERVAARVMATCQRSLDPASQETARRFLASHPQSVYSTRVRDLCELGPDKETTAGTRKPAKGPEPSGH